MQVLIALKKPSIIYIIIFLSIYFFALYLFGICLFINFFLNLLFPCEQYQQINSCFFSIFLLYLVR